MYLILRPQEDARGNSTTFLELSSSVKAAEGLVMLFESASHLCFFRQCRSLFDVSCDPFSLLKPFDKINVLRYVA